LLKYHSLFTKYDKDEIKISKTKKTHVLKSLTSRRMKM